jgi:hypothetical protein
LGPNCAPTCSTNRSGHITALYFTFVGSPRFQPHEAKSWQPLMKRVGSWSHKWMHSAVLAQPCCHQLPRAALCSLVSKPVPGLRPQTLFVE